jgi:hypothetical protein
LVVARGVDEARKSEPVTEASPETESVVKGEVVPSPSLLFVSSKKKLALSCDTCPRELAKRTEPEVKPESVVVPTIVRFVMVGEERDTEAREPPVTVGFEMVGDGIVTPVGRLSIFWVSPQTGVEGGWYEE